MDADSNKISGVIVPVVTPVDDNDCVDEKAFRQVIRYCIEGGVDGIFVGGSAGMGPLLTEIQWQRAMAIARQEVDKSKILMGGIICTSTAIALQRVAFLESQGYNNFVVTPTFYLRPEKDEHFFVHFDKCRQKTDMNMVVYNIPGCTNCQIPLNVLEKMASEGYFKVAKESSGDKAYFSEVMKIAAGYGINVLQGSESNAKWGLMLGASGLVPVCANFEPQTYVNAWKAAAAKDWATLDVLQNRMNSLCENVLAKSGYWISGIMYVLHLYGIGDGRPVYPLTECGQAAKEAIRSFIEKGR